MEQGMAEGQGRLDPSPIRLLACANCQMPTHADTPSSLQLLQIDHSCSYSLEPNPNQAKPNQTTKSNCPLPTHADTPSTLQLLKIDQSCLLSKKL